MGVGNAMGFCVTSTSVGGTACLVVGSVQDVRNARKKMKVRRRKSLIRNGYVIARSDSDEAISECQVGDCFALPARNTVPAVGASVTSIGLLKILLHQIRNISRRMFTENTEEISRRCTTTCKLCVIILEKCKEYLIADFFA